MCELDGFMYVTGGAESWNCLNTVERYNPENNTWTLVAPMNVARRGAGVAVHAGEAATDRLAAPSSKRRKDPRAFRRIMVRSNFSASVQANCSLLAVSTAPTRSAAWRCTIPPATSGGCWVA